MEQKTPLYQQHINAKGRIVNFGGYLLPVQYPSGVIAEHLAVRNAAGMFDLSHMGEVWLTGAGATATLQTVMTNDLSTLKDGGCRYSPICNEEGGIIDDVIIYKVNNTKYLVVTNASRTAKDVDWMRQNKAPDTEIHDRSDETALIALQGPKAKAILTQVAQAAELPERFYTFTEEMAVAGVPCLVSATGYTGEDGYELYCPANDAPTIWQALIEAGEASGLLLCGLGARDTLRLEAGMPLYGNEMDENTTPYEAGLGSFVKLDKAQFIGKKALQDKTKPARLRTGLKITGRGIARDGMTVYYQGQPVGTTTSGTKLPFVDYAGAMAFINRECREPGTELEVEVRNRMVPAQVVPLPFYKKQK